MTRYEDVTQDEVITEAVINITTAIRRIAPVAAFLHARRSGMAAELDEATADLDQAKRWLLGEEVPE